MCKHASETGIFLKCLVKPPVNICSVEDKQVPGWVLVCVRGGQAVNGTGLCAQDKGLSLLVITPCTTPQRDLAFPCLSHFTHTLDLLYCSLWWLLQNRSNPAQMCVLKAQGWLRQAGFLSEFLNAVFATDFSLSSLNICVECWVATEGLHWVGTGQWGSWE